MKHTAVHGIIPPMVTPLCGRDELDIPGLENLIEHIIAGGVNGVFILGTTGEGPSLSYRLRRELIERVCRQVQRRIQVLVGITDTAFVETVTLARYAAEAGADATVLAPPYYMPEGQPELREYLDHLIPELPLPVYLYNMPALTKVAFELETIRHAMQYPGVVGLKDSSGDMDYFREAVKVARQRTGWPVLVGPEELLLESLRAGGNGGVSGGANLFPQLYVELFKAAQTASEKRATELQALVMRISNDLYKIGQHPSSIIKGIKCALSVFGICNDFMAEPFHRFRSGERSLVQGRARKIQELLENLAKVPVTTTR
jgi:dihydrodipicolinate synthase/N-acetylneuraminate lyase